MSYEFLSDILKIGASVLELVGLTITFWHKTGRVYRIEHPKESDGSDGRTKEALKSKITWLCSAFFFIYMGIEGTHSDLYTLSCSWTLADSLVY